MTQRQLTDGDWEVDGKEVSKLMLKIYKYNKYNININIKMLMQVYQFSDLGGWKSQTYLLYGHQRHTPGTASVSIILYY